MIGYSDLIVLKDRASVAEQRPDYVRVTELEYINFNSRLNQKAGPFCQG